MLLGHARGKVGDLVFSRSNGQQVVRARAAVVKNPKTELQTIQRIILNTVAQAYSKMQPIVNHSFEGVSEGQRSMSRFMRTNLDRIRARVAQAVANNESYDDIYAFAPIGTNAYAPNEFVISTGSLPSVAVTFPTSNSTNAVATLGGNTYGDVIEALGLQRGDQLTFVMIKSAGAATGEVSFDYARIILDPTNADGSAAPLDTPLLSDDGVNLPSPRNTGEFSLISFDSVGELSFNTGGLSRACYAAAVIVSRQSGSGEWQRSNTQLVVNERTTAGFTYSLDAAIQFSQENTLGALSELYLNNAGQGAIAGAGAGAAIRMSVGTTSSHANTADLVRFGYQTNSGGVECLVGYDASNNQYPVIVGNSESVYFGKCIGKAAATTTDVRLNNEEFPNAGLSSPFALLNNEAVYALQARGYLSTTAIAIGNLLES